MGWIPSTVSVYLRFLSSECLGISESDRKSVEWAPGYGFIILYLILKIYYLYNDDSA